MKKMRSSYIWGLAAIPWALGTLMLTVVGIFALAPFLGTKRAYFAVGKRWVRQQLWFCGSSWSSTGWENLPEEIRSGKQSAVFMSNHESHLDPPLLMEAIPVPAIYIAKKELKRMPLVGWAAWAAGMIFIDRSNVERAAKSIEDAVNRIKNGNSVVIFPEGTRTRDGRIGKFKKGGFSLAMKAGVPVIPIATMGGWEILPKGAKRFNSGIMHVIFGSAVYPGQCQTRERLMEDVEKQIREMASKIRPA